MKTVSFLRPWKRRDSKVSKSPAVDDDNHLPLQYPVEQVYQPVILPRFTTTPTGPPSSTTPLPPLESPASNFSNSVEETLQQHRGTDQPFSANYRSSPNMGPSKMIFHPSPPLPTIGSPNRFHGPPRNEKHGPSSILESQLLTFNSASPHSSPQKSQAAGRNAVNVRSPTRVKFDTSVHIFDDSAPHARISFTPASNDLDSHLGNGQNERRASISPTSRTELPQEEVRAFHRRDPSLSRSEQNRSPGMNGHAALPGLDVKARGLTSSRSTPHLRPTGEYSFRNNPLPPLPSPSDDISSLFPVPPPLIIRKKRPQPLVLDPQAISRPLPMRPIPSPNSSSTDSTFVATPHSSLASQISTHINPPMKSPLGRNGIAIPPMLHNPPTTPLPSPPTKPSPLASNSPLPRQMTQSLESLGRLKPSLSVNNLRRGGSPPNFPTHRMTSSDPIADVAGQPMKYRRSSPLKLDHTVRKPSRGIDRREEIEPSPQEGTVNWGYAL